MKRATYLIVQGLCVVILLASGVVLSFILMWLVAAHGVIACGKGVFDSPTWLLDIIILVGIPAVSVLGAGSLFVWCSYAKCTLHSDSDQQQFTV